MTNSPMLRISSYTFGCKLNQSETESALSILADSGYEVVSWESGADLYLINTCTVTSKGEQKARRLIRQVQQLWPQAVVLAVGCYAVLERQKLEALGDRICALADQPARLCQLLADQPLANSDELLELLRSSIAQLEVTGRQLEAGVARQIDFPDVLLRWQPNSKIKDHQHQHHGWVTAPPIALRNSSSNSSSNSSGDSWALSQITPNISDLAPSQIPVAVPAKTAKTAKTPARAKVRQRYFFKIQDGCNRSCSFCRIRIARGPSRSLALPLLVNQLQKLEAEGYAEAVITGVHINSYHYRDEASGRNYFLGELLLELLRQTQHIRLRLSSLEPEGLESEPALQLLRALASSRICPHFHISLQSGSEHVLRQMRRGYTAAQQLRYIQKLKELRPRAFFSCDVIVGFPGERDEDFLATYELLQTQEFSAVHGFSYSPRPGTDAFAMPRIQESIVKQRMQRLQSLAAQLQSNYLERCLGQEVQVLLEELRDGYWFGYSENYVRTRIAAPRPKSDRERALEGNARSWQSGDLVQVCLQRSEPNQAESNKPDEIIEVDAVELWLEGIPNA